MRRFVLTFGASVALLVASAATARAQSTPAPPAAQVDSNSPVVKSIRAFIQTVSTSDAPFSMRTETLRSLDAILLSTRKDEAEATARLATERATFVERMALVAEFDALAARVYKDAPSGHPDFIKNSRDEIMRFRNNVGNRAGYASKETFEAVRLDYEQRLAMLRLIVQISDRLGTVDAAARAPLRARLDTLTWTVDRYDTGKRVDEERIRQMHKDVVKPKPPA